MKVEAVQGKVQSKTRFMRIHWDQDGKCKFGTRCTFRQSSELTPTTWTPQNSWKGQSCEKETVCQHQCKPAAALAGNGWYSWTRMSGKCRWRGPWQDFHAMTCDHFSSPALFTHNALVITTAHTHTIHRLFIRASHRHTHPSPQAISQACHYSMGSNDCTGHSLTVQCHCKDFSKLNCCCYLRQCGTCACYAQCFLNVLNGALNLQ